MSKVKQSPKILPASPLIPAEPFYQKDWSSLILLVLLTYIAYIPVLSADFTNWDEKRYIFETPLVQQLSWTNIKLMFQNKVLNSYNPFVLISLAWDYSIAGAKATFYHKHNLALHLINTSLVFIWVRKLNLSWFIAFFTALFFGVHPLHTESVAWIASRKDVLYVLYYMLALISYTVYSVSEKKIYLAGSALAFIAALFSKSQAVTLPLMLIGIDFLLQKDLSLKKQWNKIPFFILSVIFGYVTINGSFSSMTADEFGASFNFIEKIFISTHALFLYSVKAIIPVNQSAIYAFTTDPDGKLEWFSYASLFVIPAFLFIAYLALKNSKVLFFGLCFFLVNIALVLHVIATNSSLIYERFTYIAYIGLFIFFLQLMESKVSVSSRIAIAAGVGFLFIVFSYNRNEVWKDSESLWSDIIEKQPTISVAYNNRGNVYYDRADWLNAEADFKKAIEINPKYPNSYSNLGSVYVYLKRFQESQALNEKAISINPAFSEAWMGKGVALYNMNRDSEAITCYNKAIKLIPNFPNAYNNRAGAYFKTKKYDLAIADFRKAIRLSPDYDEAKINMSLVQLELKKFEEAIETINSISDKQRVSATLSDAYLKYGLSEYQKGNKDKAIELYNQSITANPNNAEAYYNLGGTYLMANDIEKAKQNWKQCLQLNPNHEQAKFWLNKIGG